MAGLREMPIHNVSFDNIIVEMATGDDVKGHFPADWYGQKDIVGRGFLCRNIKDVRFNNFEIRNTRSAALHIDNSRNVEVSGLQSSFERPVPAAIEVRDIGRCFFRRCGVTGGGSVFMKVAGKNNRDIYLSETEAIECADKAVFSDGAGKNCVKFV